ncbi:MAG: glycosyltransferase family 1 protein, partial [Proteobacteria bacterium]|nr:glycosyltransferase family 1 protein [Pseudomonadota bacterium]
MRVSHVITRLIVGGAQENTLSSVVGLGRRPDWEVELISGPTRGAEGSLESVARAVPGLLRVEPSLVRPVHPLMDGLAYLRLKAHFRRTRPHIVHTHSGKAGIVGRFAARHAGVPLVIHTIHGPS